MKAGWIRIALALLVFSPSLSWGQDELPIAFSRKVPETLKDLQDIQKHVRELTKKVMPATVGVRIGQSSGSGVIIDKEGHVLTAGHVSGDADRVCELILPDGKKLKGKTLGANRGIDSGMILITDKADFPYVEMGEISGVKKGTWCMAIGHPGGFQKNRNPVVRLGRILETNPNFLRSDCTLVGGDSGGPLFDMNGKVIGIHSRIGGAITQNIHVPVNTYRETFDRLAKAEIWGANIFNAGKATDEAYLGVQMNPDVKGCKVQIVSPKSPAEKAGLRTDDLITRIDGQQIGSPDDLIKLIKGKRPGNELAIELQRGEEIVRLKVVLEKKPAG